VRCVKAAIYLLGGLAVVVFFVVRQRQSDRFRERSLLFPLALGIYGVVALTDTTKHHALSVASASLLLLSAAASIGFGVIRGRTIELFERAGELWERASWTTIAVGWGGLRVALLDPAHAWDHARHADARRTAARQVHRGRDRSLPKIATALAVLRLESLTQAEAACGCLPAPWHRARAAAP
jgi:hypothetical protein